MEDRSRNLGHMCLKASLRCRDGTGAKLQSRLRQGVSLPRVNALVRRARKLIPYPLDCVKPNGADHPIFLDHDADTSPKESPKRDLRSSKRDSSVSSKVDLHGSSKKDPTGWITIPGLERVREARKRKLHEDQTDNEHLLRSERPTKKARAEENRAREKIAQLKQVCGKFKV